METAPFYVYHISITTQAPGFQDKKNAAYFYKDLRDAQTTKEVPATPPPISRTMNGYYLFSEAPLHDTHYQSEFPKIRIAKKIFQFNVTTKFLESVNLTADKRATLENLQQLLSPFCISLAALTKDWREQYFKDFTYLPLNNGFKPPVELTDLPKLYFIPVFPATISSVESSNFKPLIQEITKKADFEFGNYDEKNNNFITNNLSNGDFRALINLTSIYNRFASILGPKSSLSETFFSLTKCRKNDEIISILSSENSKNSAEIYQKIISFHGKLLLDPQNSEIYLLHGFDFTIKIDDISYFRSKKNISFSEHYEKIGKKIEKGEIFVAVQKLSLNFLAKIHDDKFFSPFFELNNKKNLLKAFKLSPELSLRPISHFQLISSLPFTFLTTINALPFLSAAYLSLQAHHLWLKSLGKLDLAPSRLPELFTVFNLSQQSPYHNDIFLAPIFKSNNYEIYEFLGDAVLDFVVIKSLLTRKSDSTPKSLNIEKMRLVSNDFLAEISEKLALKSFLAPVNYAKKASADLVEALIGFVYSVLGLKNTASFIIEAIFGDVKKIGNFQDFLGKIDFKPKKFLVNFGPENLVFYKKNHNFILEKSDFKDFVQNWAQNFDFSAPKISSEKIFLENNKILIEISNLINEKIQKKIEIEDFKLLFCKESFENLEILGDSVFKLSIVQDYYEAFSSFCSHGAGALYKTNICSNNWQAAFVIDKMPILAELAALFCHSETINFETKAVADALEAVVGLICHSAGFREASNFVGEYLDYFGAISPQKPFIDAQSCLEMAKISAEKNLASQNFYEKYFIAKKLLKNHKKFLFEAQNSLFKGAQTSNPIEASISASNS